MACHRNHGIFNSWNLGVMKKEEKDQDQGLYQSQKEELRRNMIPYVKLKALASLMTCYTMGSCYHWNVSEETFQSLQTISYISVQW